MLDSFGLIAGVLLLSFGGKLLYDSVSNSLATSSGLLLGAVLSTAGLLTILLIVWSRWKRARSTMEPRGIERWERPKRPR